MKKIILYFALVGMLAWVVYDYSPPPGGIASYENNAERPPAAQETMAVANSEEVGVQVGDVAPDFEITTLEGETVKLSDYRGERVMLNFWATWCPPCRAEMPAMQQFYEEHDVTVLAVNLTDTETNPKNAADFVSAYDLTFPILMDKEAEVSTLYRIKPIPASFMIDESGRIQYRSYGAMTYEMMVEELEKME
nr:redoxin domain-containing protein [Lentibacillus sediminis]